MALHDAQPPSPASTSSSFHRRHDSFSSSTSDGSSAPVHSLDSSSSLSEARPSSIPSSSSAADPPVGQPVPRAGSRRSLSTFRSSGSSEKRQSLVAAQLDKKSFGEKLKFAFDISFAGGDPRKQVRSYQEPIIVRSAKARAIDISRTSSRPSTATSVSIPVSPNTQQSHYTSKPFAFRHITAPEPRPEAEAQVPELDSTELPDPRAPRQTHVYELPVPPQRPSSWRLANLNDRLEQQLELPPVIEEEDEFEVDEMGFVRNLASRLQRIHTPPNSAPVKSRPVISLPLELVSASNNIIYDAPDLGTFAMQHERVISTSTQNSEDSETSMFSDPGLTDSSSVSSESSPNASSSDGSPITANFDAARTSYYNPEQYPLVHPIPVSPMKVGLNEPIQVVASGETTTLPPAVPQRAMSHSKREHVRLARARSMRSRSASRAPSEAPMSHHTSLTNLAETPEAVSPLEGSVHPFGTELAELDHMAQELARAAAAEHARRSMMEDHVAMVNAGLEQYTARDYQFDLDSLIGELSSSEENPWESALPRPLAV